MIFGFLFDFLGRKQIFIMRVFVSSIATIIIPFIKINAIGGLAIVMTSVSLTVPFIPDFVKKEKRGIAYAWLGLTFILSTIIVLLVFEFDVLQKVDLKWLFVTVGIFGIVIDIILCWGFSDKYKLSMKLKNLKLKYTILLIFFTFSLGKSFKEFLEEFCHHFNKIKGSL